MKRSGFTLIELIFVIVIIGVLAAVAIPKFQNLKQNAEAANVIKVAIDAYGSVPSAFVNRVDLEEDKNATGTNAIVLSDMVTVNGKGWSVDDGAGTATYADDGDVAVLTFSGANRTVQLQITCANFADSTTETKCEKKLGSATLDQTATF